MWLEQKIRKETGCATYLVGSFETKECAVFDPLWDIEPYLEVAKSYSSKIRYVIDSHSHADHVSGARRLAHVTSGELVLPELADTNYPSTRVKGKDKLSLGEVELEVLHTPGHRPEQICLLISDKSRGSSPCCMFTADFLLVGDVGRPDLVGKGHEGASTIFKKSLPQLEKLPDFLEIYPGHVMGST